MDDIQCPIKSMPIKEASNESSDELSDELNDMTEMEQETKRVET